ncbi:hypothetical protein KSP40_PGU019867 [Platanthera guangdongensis]|uniref:Uncharacterized protein n=1 Tax=Platanthera guangdongensis TaxID=2320717 RepID=A0ABR2LWB6_9ASPA
MRRVWPGGCRCGVASRHRGVVDVAQWELLHLRAFFAGNVGEGADLEQEEKIAGLQSCAEDSDIRNVASDTSLGRQNGAISRQSSVRNVALCVLAAVTFGLALGVKDGLGKASEYFAGYDLSTSP